MSMLGIIHARGNGDLKVAEDLWFRGAADKESPEAASDCVENLAISYINGNKPQAAAYCIRWANMLAAAPARRKSVRSGIWEKGAQGLSEAQFAALTKKESGFSRDDLDAFVKGGISPVAAETAGAGGGKPEVAPPVSTMVDGKAYIEVARKKAETAVEIPDGSLTRPLPAKPGEVIMGYAGTCLLMKFPDLMKLGVFDLCQAKVVKYIDLAEKDAVFAAGGKVLLIFLPEAKRFELWDMESWTKRKDVALRSDIGIEAMGMGLLNHDFAVVVRAEGDPQAQDKVAILSIPDCKLTVPKFRQSNKGMDLFHFFAHLGKGAGVMMEENGSMALVTGSGRGFIKLGNRESVEASYLHLGSSRDVSVVFGGAEVVIENDDVYRAEEEEALLRKSEQKLDRHTRREFVSGISGYRGIVEIGRADGNEEPCLKVRSLPQLNEVYCQPIDKDVFRKISFGGGRRLYASAYVKRCAIVDEKNNSVILFRLDTVAATTVGQIAPGSLFVRKLNLADGTKVEIDSAPEGLSYDAKSSEIRWQIPNEQARAAEVSVILLLTDDQGNQSYHVEKIAIP